MKRLVLASRNQGKIKELREMVEGYSFEVYSLNDYKEIDEIKETGSSFRENALIKARSVARYTGEIALADDSGLEIDELSGAPGIYSARFAGEEKDDEANNKKVLQMLKGVPLERRSARFRCVVAVVTPSGKEEIREGTCEGKIAFKPKGDFGFGYDPLFVVDGYGCSMAELDPKIKNKISHRAEAFRKVLPLLKKLYD